VAKIVRLMKQEADIVIYDIDYCWNLQASAKIS